MLRRDEKLTRGIMYYVIRSANTKRKLLRSVRGEKKNKVTIKWPRFPISAAASALAMAAKNTDNDARREKRDEITRVSYSARPSAGGVRVRLTRVQRTSGVARGWKKKISGESDPARQQQQRHPFPPTTLFFILFLFHFTPKCAESSIVLV